MAARSLERRGVVDDACSEAIIELARWDLTLAGDLAERWDGNPATLPALLPRPPAWEGPRVRAGRSSAPPAAVADAWATGSIGLWHGDVCYQADAVLAAPDARGGALWSAQARVFLPWVESRRARLVQRLAAEVGEGALRDHLAEGHGDGAAAQELSLVEIGALASAAGGLLARESVLLRAARSLCDARNRLAHLQPLGLADQRPLVADCAPLAGG